MCRITLHQQTKNQSDQQQRMVLKRYHAIKLLAVGGGFEPPTVQLATVQHLVVNPSRPFGRHYAAFILYHHPRDRRARLPISTSYSMKENVANINSLTSS